MSKLKTGAEIVYDSLISHNVKNVFGYSGGAIMSVIDKFYNKNDIKLYINTHEQNLGHSATGYAKSSGQTGISIVTSGPGLTNMVTPLLDALTDSTPLVVISGQVPKSAMGTNAFQECDATSITKSITKKNYCVKHIDELPSILDEAFYIANYKKPGPVHIDIPKCVLNSETRELSYFKPSNSINFIDPNNIKKIAKKINESNSPILYIGKGANHCQTILTKIVDTFNIPITTTLHAVGVVSENNPLSLKFLGMHGNPSANFAIQQSDCIIAVGSRFDDRTTGAINKYALNARKNKGIIHCNIEDLEINKVVACDYKVVGNSEDFLNSLYPLLKKRDRTCWISQIHKLSKDYPLKFTDCTNFKFKTQHAITSINKYITPDTIITTGVGNHQMMTAQFIKWRNPNKLITSGSLGVMGVALPYAIGAQIANPDNKVITIDGDGSFLQTLSDLATVAKYNIPIKMFIMNDGHQSMVRTWEKLFYNERYVATETGNYNFKAIANSFDIPAYSCNNIDELDVIIKKCMNTSGPVLCDLKTVTDSCYPLVAPGKALDDMLFEEKNEKECFTGLAPN